MKKGILFLLAVGIFAGCGTKYEATVEGTVTGLPDNTKVYLLDSSQEKVDSTTLSGGTFRFGLKEAYPDMAYLLFDGQRQAFSFFREPGTVTVLTDFDAGTVKFTGTDSNDRMAALNEGVAIYSERMQQLAPRLIALEEAGDLSAEYDSLLAVYRSISRERGEYTDKMILGNHHTVFAAYLLNSNAHSLTTPEMMDSVLNLVAQAPANAFTDRMKERREILARTAVGQTAPDFTQNRPDGTPFTLSSLKGKVVLIDFWASWCGPCRAENPNVVKIYDKYKDHGFEIVGVSLDRNREDWLQGIEEDGLTWIHVSDLRYWDSAVAKQYAVRSIPHTVLLDKEGKIIAKNLRGDRLEEAVTKALGM